MSKSAREKERSRGRDLVLLKDLVPRKDPKGGAAKPVFGERATTASGTPEPPPAKKDRRRR